MNTLVLIAAIAVRNPFWPIGYEGEKEAISAEPVVEAQPVVTQEEETATALSTAESVTAEPEESDKEKELKAKALADKQWTEARKTLRIGGTATVTDDDGTKHHCIMINGLAYGNNDLISINHDNRRFTWRVKGLVKGETVKLVRVRSKPLENDSALPNVINNLKEKK